MDGVDPDQERNPETAAARVALEQVRFRWILDVEEGADLAAFDQCGNLGRVEIGVDPVRITGLHLFERQLFLGLLDMFETTYSHIWPTFSVSVMRSIRSSTRDSSERFGS